MVVSGSIGCTRTGQHPSIQLIGPRDSFCFTSLGISDGIVLQQKSTWTAQLPGYIQYIFDPEELLADKMRRQYTSITTSII